ncbi:hypothetical protein BT96DRAFT_1092242 [Gymnopus androsaceus JB14]|uniref:Uncharacterized protein n=1 Tax=Gymnopus androsaceus JB14 TaxID=1447944 RepID=A0A6A4HU81_9AGAR|nr:hypothetical protein BT96DRAFT_1092242 [Gymnopus androsaceus JB14]
MANTPAPLLVLFNTIFELTKWLDEVAPNTKPFLCRDLALYAYGNRHTTLLDTNIALDLSSSKHPVLGKTVDMNSLKQEVAKDNRFIAGPKIYIKMGSYEVQIDFVNAQMFWSPFNTPDMIDTELTRFPCLNLQMLLHLGQCMDLAKQVIEEFWNLMDELEPQLMESVNEMKENWVALLSSSGDAAKPFIDKWSMSAKYSTKYINTAIKY